MKSVICCLLMVTSILFSCASIGRGVGVSLIEAIEQSAETIAADIPKGSIVAVVNFETIDHELSNFVMRELNGALVDRGITVVNRQSLEFVERELDFQMSGAVSDETVQSIGRFFGAEVIIIGELIDTGRVYRFRTEAINVETAVQGSIVRLDVRNDRATSRMISALASQPRTARVEEAPANTSLFFLERGITLAMRGDFELAIMNFTDAIELDPNLVGAYMLRGRALFASVSDVIGMGEYFSSVTAIVQDRNEISQERQMAYDQAIEDFTQAIILLPNNARVFRERGRIFLSMGDLDNAIMDFNDAIRRDPEFAWAYQNRGLVHSARNDLDRAIADFSQAIGIEPNFANAYLSRGLVHLARNDLNRAMADFSRAISIDPNLGGAFVARGAVYFNKNILDRAIDDFSRAIRLGSNDASIFARRGLAYFDQNDFDRAIADFSQAINNERVALDIRIASYQLRGSAHFNRRRDGDLERAISDWEAVLRIDPNKQPQSRALRY